MALFVCVGEIPARRRASFGSEHLGCFVYRHNGHSMRLRHEQRSIHDRVHTWRRDLHMERSVFSLQALATAHVGIPYRSPSSAAKPAKRRDCDASI